MKPISLHGHERSITMIRYNREGDLLFSSAKDQFPNVWYSINGERLGTFGSSINRDADSHSGAVWCIDVDWETKNFLSGAADNSLRLWDVCTGKLLNKIETKSAVRTAIFSYCGNYVAYSNDKSMGQQCVITLVDTRNFQSENAVMSIAIPSHAPKVTASLFGSLESNGIGKLLTGHDNGDIALWDIRNKKKDHLSREHGKTISDMQLSADRTMFISSSKDCTAKLFDTSSLECLKTYTTERPVNSASISPKYEHVVLGGGQEAMEVTTTSTRIGKFDARFFHLVYEEEFGRVKGHFGPINSVQFSPDGLGYASGGEDGYVRLHSFDQAYYEFDMERA